MQRAFQEEQQYYQTFFIGSDGHLAEIFANFPIDFWKSLFEKFYFLLKLVEILHT